MGFAYTDNFPATNALILPTPPTPCNSITVTEMLQRAKSHQHTPSININAIDNTIVLIPLIDLTDMSTDSQSMISITDDTIEDNDEATSSKVQSLFTNKT